MASILHTTHAVNDPMPDFGDMTPGDWFDAWSDADMRSRRLNGCTVTEWVARDIWEVLDPVDGFEHASPHDCSCRRLHPAQRPTNLPPCVHMRAVAQFLTARQQEDSATYDAWVDFTETVAQDWEI